MPKKVILVAVGDVSSEKTKLLLEYTYTTPHRQCLPTTFVDNFQDIVVDSVPYSVYFMDTDPEGKYKTLRKDIYTQADSILLCYSIKDRRSFENIKNKWIVDIRVVAPYTPIVLVATGIEARTTSAPYTTITPEEGMNLKYLIGAAAFKECSVATYLGIDNVFIEAIRSTYPKGCCSAKRK